MAKAFQVTGIKSIDQALAKLEPKVKKKMVKRAMRPAMKPILKAAKSNAPVDTGATKRAIKIRAAKRSRTTMGIDVRIGEGDYKGEQYYAAFVEYGTSKMEPKPFLRPAYDTGKDKAKTDTIEAIKKLILEEAKK